eukprot:CAMPEP_0171574098 /NCGR_PEP_ID=MMETSP0961-20121227/5149_1 /TAXON_ID=87120 /ORGANISM="Aurantiochytrium limacinum, Strain ATCCMYA-1381" /LENGTH=104 /DNA_ID=CAMNT_0012129337 /DNA_START=16 /DNA_END=330 /DNA_ORIENTATION=+
MMSWYNESRGRGKGFVCSKLRDCVAGSRDESPCAVAPEVYRDSMEQQLGNEYVTNVTNETMFASGGVANGGVAKKRIAVGYAMVHIEWIPQLVRAFVLDESEMK